MCWTCNNLKHEVAPGHDQPAVVGLQTNVLDPLERSAFRTRLWITAYDTLSGLIATRRLSSIRIHHRHRPLSDTEAEALTYETDARHRVVAEAIADTLDNFLIDLAAGDSWRPDGGASLTTYWLRGVAGAVYRRAGAWANERQRRLHELSRTGTITQLALAGTTDLALGPERMAQVEVLREVLPPAGDHSVKAKQTRAIAVGYLSGKTRGEIATQLRINPSRVDYLLRTLRAHALSRVTLGVIDPTVIPGFVDSVRTHADTADVVAANFRISTDHARDLIEVCSLPKGWAD